MLWRDGNTNVYKTGDANRFQLQASLCFLSFSSCFSLSAPFLSCFLLAGQQVPVLLLLSGWGVTPSIHPPQYLKVAVAANTMLQ